LPLILTKTIVVLTTIVKHPTMAEGIRVQIVLPPGLAEALKARAEAERRSVSNLGTYLIEAGLRDLPSLSHVRPEN
jgi:hypothetical protein